MMDFLLLIVWLLLTVIPGACFLHRQLPREQAGRWCLVLGYGALIGLMLVPLIMRSLNLLGMSFSLWGIAAGAVALASVGLLLPRASYTSVPATAESSTPGKLANLVFAVCMALIALRLFTLGIEVSLRPVFAWDSKQHWGKQARVLFEARELVPFVDLQGWLQHRTSDGAPVFTNMHPDYPVTVPLMQVWANLPWETWSDTRMNMAWLLCWMALGLAFFGQLRSAGADRTIAAAATYMLLSLPYLNIQVALAGYADLMLAAGFCAALAAFHNWTQSRHHWQGLLALFFSLSLPLLKNEGFYWALSMLPGLVVLQLGLYRGVCVGVGLLFGLIGVLLFLPPDLVIAGHSLGDMRLGFHPESAVPLARSLFLHDNWHLLAYVFPTLVMAVALCRRQLLSAHAPVLAVVICALALYLALYLGTRHAYGAIHFTSLNRVGLQIMPAIAFVSALLFACLSRAAPTTTGTVTHS